MKSSSAPSLVRISYATGNYDNRINGDWSLADESITGKSDGSPQAATKYTKLNDAEAIMQYDPHFLCWFIKIPSEVEPIARLPGLASSLLGREIRGKYIWSIRFGPYRDEESFIPQRNVAVFIVNNSTISTTSPLIITASKYALSDHLEEFAITGATGNYSLELNTFWRKSSDRVSNGCPIYESNESPIHTLEYSANNNQWLLHDQTTLGYDAAALAVFPSHPYSAMPINLITNSQWRMIDRQKATFEVQTSVQILSGEEYKIFRNEHEERVALTKQNESEARENAPKNLRISGVTGIHAKWVNGVFVPDTANPGLYWKNKRNEKQGTIEFSKDLQQWQWKPEGSQESVAYLVAPRMSVKQDQQGVFKPVPVRLHRLGPEGTSYGGSGYPLVVNDGTGFSPQPNAYIHFGDDIKPQSCDVEGVCWGCCGPVCTVVGCICWPCFQYIEFEQRHPCLCLARECCFWFLR